MMSSELSSAVKQDDIFNQRSLQYFPLSIALIIFTFWFCVRVPPEKTLKMPKVLVLLESPWFQGITFIAFAFFLSWALWSFTSKKIWSIGIPIAVGAAMDVYEYSYPIFSRVDHVILFHHFCVITGAILGTVFFQLILRIVGEKRNDQLRVKKVSLRPLSTYRDYMMGFAIILILIFHTLNMAMDYKFFLPLYYVVRSGYIGVDVFMFTSGIGITYSLTKNKDISMFYKKRLMRIFPMYIPVVFLYTMTAYILHQCKASLIITNCLAVSYWFCDNPFVFNWYIPAILLFYLISPVIYQILKKPENRILKLIFLWFLALILIVDVSEIFHLEKYRIVMCRFPVFCIGMAIGFGILEGKEIDWKDFMASIMVAAFAGILYVIHELIMPITGWHYLMFIFIVPVFCLLIARKMERAEQNTVLMCSLKWMGKNSLLIYLLNIVFSEMTDQFIGSYLQSHQMQCAVYCIVMIVLNIGIVYIFEKWKIVWKK